MDQRTVRLGGVENTGNSCIFSVMLQDFAALPQFYDYLLYNPIQKGLKESVTRYAARQVMQHKLRRCVENIRSGKKVEHIEVRALAEQLQKLGWQGHLSSAWRCFLNRLAPSIFPLTLYSAYDLYEKTLFCLLEEVPSAPVHIVLTGKRSRELFSEFFASHSEFLKMRSATFWRVSLDTSPSFLEESFQIGSWEFSLQLVHVYQTNTFGKHVVVYRKHEGAWVCCNDTRITHAAPSVADSIYTMVYESRCF